MSARINLSENTRETNRDTCVPSSHQLEITSCLLAECVFLHQHYHTVKMFIGLKALGYKDTTYNIIEKNRGLSTQVRGAKGVITPAEGEHPHFCPRTNNLSSCLFGAITPMYSSKNNKWRNHRCKFRQGTAGTCPHLYRVPTISQSGNTMHCC